MGIKFVVVSSCTVFLHSAASEAPGGELLHLQSHFNSSLRRKNGAIESKLLIPKISLTHQDVQALLPVSKLILCTINSVKSSWFCLSAVVKCWLQLWHSVERKSVSGDGAVFPTRLVDKLSQSWCPGEPCPAVRCVAAVFPELVDLSWQKAL